MIGLLLMVRINYQHRLIMNRRRIPCLDGYLDRVNLVLWPRFKARLCRRPPLPAIRPVAPNLSNVSHGSRLRSGAGRRLEA